jgi:hypothetical protein
MRYVQFGAVVLSMLTLASCLSQYDPPKERHDVQTPAVLVQAY